MGLIKSYGNYVIQKKHQLINDGTIFERDYSTVGGVGDNFNSPQKMYQQGTFIYGVNDEIVSNKIYNQGEWEKNGDNEYWNQENIQVKNLKNDSLNIFLKQNSYKLKEFAYFGSCVELIKNSLNDIILTFPGELYSPYDENGEGIVVLTSEDKQLGENGFIYLIDNPFGLDIHTSMPLLDIEEISNVKYIIPNFEDYEIITLDGGTYSINDIEITLYQGKCYPYKFADIQITYGNSVLSMVIHGYYNEQGQVFYLTHKDFLGIHIRPKETIINNFFKNLNSFQKILLNKDSQPIYSTIFEVQEETEYGYQTFYKKFTFPLSEGNYNLDIVSERYSSYINSLSKYAAFFDNLYCNNLYRNMTHESIKNFDWTDVLQRGNEIKEDYIENAGKIEQMLLLCGREMDEIKFYIDGIKNANTISYNDSNNLPDYLLTDTLNIEGWETVNIFPLQIKENYVVEDLMYESKPYSNIINNCGNTIAYPYGYFSGYFGDDCFQSKKERNKNDINYQIDNKGCLRECIKQYINEQSYSMQSINDKFLKILKLNSRSILQKKGTIESIESLLSLFGLRSKQWYESMNKNSSRLLNEMKIDYDYEIKEYVTITNPIQEKNTIKNGVNGLPKTTYLYDFFNSTKSIGYNTKNYKNGVYEPYQGLPVRYYDVGETRLLYPYFSYQKPIDGKPYFQMKGGWIHKNYHYTDTLSVVEENGGFIDTNTQISSVANLKELLRIRQDILYDGVIYYVKDIKGYYICVNEDLYEIIEKDNYRYFKVPIKNNVLTIGNQQWFGLIETYNEKYEIIELNTLNFNDGQYISIFIKNDNTIYINQDDNIIINYIIINDGQIMDNTDNDNSNGTHYFLLNDKKWSKTLGLWGWNQLTTDDDRYKTLKSFMRNNKANNPHANGFLYDDGSEYLKFFAQLFKYAISNELFDSNCYTSMREYMTSLNEIETNIGFKNLFIDDDICGTEINKIEDKKIHHFCNIINNEGIIKHFYEFNENINNGYTFYDKEEYKKLNENNFLFGSVTSQRTCLDQIINIKNIDIIFKKISDEPSQILLQRKYFDKVILHYLMQIIPSNIILNIKYE